MSNIRKHEHERMQTYSSRPRNKRYELENEHTMASLTYTNSIRPSPLTNPYFLLHSLGNFDLMELQPVSLHHPLSSQVCFISLY